MADQTSDSTTRLVLYLQSRYDSMMNPQPQHPHSAPSFTPLPAAPSAHPSSGSPSSNSRRRSSNTRAHTRRSSLHLQRRRNPAVADDAVLGAGLDDRGAGAAAAVVAACAAGGAGGRGDAGDLGVLVRALLGVWVTASSRGESCGEGAACAGEEERCG